MIGLHRIIAVVFATLAIAIVLLWTNRYQQNKELDQQLAAIKTSQFLVSTAISELNELNTNSRDNVDLSGWLTHYLRQQLQTAALSQPQMSQVRTKLQLFIDNFGALVRHHVAIKVQTTALAQQRRSVQVSGQDRQKLSAFWLEHDYLNDAQLSNQQRLTLLKVLPPLIQTRIVAHGNALQRELALYRSRLGQLQQAQVPMALQEHFSLIEKQKVTNASRQGWLGAALLALLLGAIGLDLIRRLQQERELNRELKRVTELKTLFLATMSHEMRTPLNAISGFSDLLKQSQLDRTQHEQVEHIGQASTTLLSLVNDIMDHTKLKAGKLELDNADFAVDDLLDELHHLFEKQCKDKKLELWVHCDPKIPRIIHSDRFRLHQVLCNLLSNACKFTEAGHIELKIVHHGTNQLRICVIDTGIGISESAQAHLFDAFTQADSSISRRFGGSGLGLAISHSLVELLGGKLTVSSQPNVGSRFEFTLPMETPDAGHQPNKGLVLLLGANTTRTRALKDILSRHHYRVIDHYTDQSPPPNVVLTTSANTYQQWQQLRSQFRVEDKIRVFRLDSEETPNSGDVSVPLPISPNALISLVSKPDSPAQLESSQQDNPLQGQQILIVDDVMTNRLVAKQIASKMGALVEVTDSGAGAIKLLTTREFDLMLLDIQMPEMDGYETCRLIRQRYPQHRSMPIVALTANVMSQRDPNLKACGFTGCITKPITRQHLLDGISTLCPELITAQPPESELVADSQQP
ncbi:hybrid sensor histidine kinase/response regulator [Ferrimonas aestuarii]|uniref:histidine kinase n=1 Tax=Ferrimonas aestuarii TaxID=2569539 RepID=A0A4U1BTE6_9GAMM|nr:ATP-binding protein [Ferrimonas aestuarii]TKB56830.1 response regulator [Ferrimonas aestuarii]